MSDIPKICEECGHVIFMIKEGHFSCTATQSRVIVNELGDREEEYYPGPNCVYRKLEKMEAELSELKDLPVEHECSMCSEEAIEKCENCQRLLCSECVEYDTEGTPLCPDCYNELKKEGESDGKTNKTIL